VGETEREHESGDGAPRQEPERPVERALELLARDRDPHRELGAGGATEGGVGRRSLEGGTREHRLLALTGARDEVGGSGLAYLLLLPLGRGHHEAVAIHDGPHGPVGDVGRGQDRGEALRGHDRDQDVAEPSVAEQGQRDRDHQTAGGRAHDEVRDLRLARPERALERVETGHARQWAPERAQEVQQLPARGIHQGHRQPPPIGLARQPRLLVELPQIGRVEIAGGREPLEPGQGGLDLAVHRDGQGAGVVQQRLLHVATLVLVGPPDRDRGDPQQRDQGQADDGEEEGPKLHGR